MPAPGTPIRRSSSRQDSSGQRHELPQQASLEVLSSMEPSPRSPSAGSRCKTPVGSAPPSRRSQQGSLRALLSASTSRIPRPPSSSLTAEASCSSERAALSSRASVASGCPGMGDTFITELRKDYPRGMVTPDGSLCAIDSAANPMQSVNNSAYFSLPAADSSYGSLDGAYSSPGARTESAATAGAAAGGHGRYADSGDDEGDDLSEYESAAGGCSSSSRMSDLESGYSQAASLLHSEATNPMMTPEGSSMSCHQSAAAGAALQVIQNLYCPAADAGSDCKQTQPGRGSLAALRRSTLGSRPSTSPATGRQVQAADRRAPVRSSMAAGSMPAAAEGGSAAATSSSSSSQAGAVGAVPSADSSDMEAQADATAASLQAGESAQDSSTGSGGEEASSEGPADVCEAPTVVPAAEAAEHEEAVLASSEAEEEHEEEEATVLAGPQQEQEQEQQQEEEEDDTQDQSRPTSPCPRTPTAAAAESNSATESAASPPSVEASSPSADEEGAEGQLSSQEVLREAEARLCARPLLQQQLADLLEGVRGKVDGEGQQLVDMPAGYEVLVERMLVEARAQNQSLFGWEGPRRFEELPISRLPGDASDPQLEAGLNRIHALDERLREADIKLLVASREAHPEQYATQEKQRLEQRQQQIEAALEAARKKRLHAAKVARALQQQALEEGAGGAAAAQQQWQEGLSEGGEASRVSSTVLDSVWRYYILSEAEEQLLEAVMARDEEALVADDPFDATRTVLEVEEAEEEATDNAAAAAAVQEGDGSGAAAGSCLEAEGTQCSTSGDTLQQGQDRESSTAAAAAAAEGRPSTPGSVHSSMFAAASCSGVSRMSRGGARRLSMADIDAQLEALHKGLPLGSDTCSQTTTLSPQQSSCLPAVPSSKSSRRRTSDASRSDVGSSRLGRLAPSAAGDAPGGIGVAQQAGSAAGAASSRDTGTVKRDYIREQRETKELLKRLKDIDASIRSLKTAELPNRLDPDQLKALLASSAAAAPQAQPSQQQLQA